MNSVDFAIGDKILINSGKSVREIAFIKDIMRNGRVIVRNSFGDIIDISPSQIIKKF